MIQYTYFLRNVKYNFKCHLRNYDECAYMGCKVIHRTYAAVRRVLDAGSSLLVAGRVVSGLIATMQVSSYRLCFVYILC